MGNTNHTTPCNTVQLNTASSKTTELTLSINKSSGSRHETHSKSVSLHSPAAKPLFLTSFASYPTSVHHTTHVSTTLFQPSPTSRNNRRRSSLLNVHNGITGKYICSRICKVAASFWCAHIETLPVSDRLELACSIFFSMVAANRHMKDLMRRASKPRTNIEGTSLKYLSMMEWIIRSLAADHHNLCALLARLGCMHRGMGVDTTHFAPMIAAIHDTFTYYFDDDVYNTEIQHALHEIFRLATTMMTGHDLYNCGTPLQGTEVPFLQNLNACLQSAVGKQCLFRYLAQTWCDEIVIFLKSLHRFKTAMDDTERFMMARYIYRSSIHATATFALNLSYEHRVNAMRRVEQLEDGVPVPHDLFFEVERETMDLIKMNHWTQFVKRINANTSHPNYL